MTLSAEQIQVLFDFTKKKYVHFFDLQSEIVDHLAAAIEDKINANQKLSFEQALEEIYKGFGIFGFSHVVREKEKQIDKQAQYMLWKEIWSLFTWPQLLLSALILISLFTLTQLIPLNILVLVTGCICMLGAIVMMVKLARMQKPKKALRMMNTYRPGFILWPYLYMQLYMYFNMQTVFSFMLFTFSAILHLISSYRVNSKIKTNAMSLYPETFAPEISN